MRYAQYVAFDCTKSHGYAYRGDFAKPIARFLTWWTGRFHDWGVMYTDGNRSWIETEKRR